MGGSSSFSIMKEVGLPEDIFFDEIIPRLPIKAICKFKCVSKVWLSNLSEFIHNKFKTKTLENKPWAIFSNINTSTQFISSCRELSHYDGFSFSFLFESYSINAEDHKLYILASTNGLVLCSIVHECTGIGRYFVCNPITKESVLLPPPPKNTSIGDFSYGLVCDTYSHSPATPCESAFKVVRTQNSLISDNRLKIEIYFSDLDEWRTYDVADNQQREGTRENVITHNGVVYWIEEDEINMDYYYTEEEDGRNRVVSYDLNKINKYECDSHQCNVLYAPIIYQHFGRQLASSECLGVSGGRVCYGHTRRNYLRVWVLDNDYIKKNYYYTDTESGWAIRHEIKLTDMLEDRIKLMGFSPTDCNVVILAFEDQIFAFDVTIEEPSFEDYLSDPPNEHLFNQHGKSEFLHSLCVPARNNSFRKSEVLHSRCVRSGKFVWDTQHYAAIIVTPTLTTISKEKNSIRKICDSLDNLTL